MTGAILFPASVAVVLLKREDLWQPPDRGIADRDDDAIAVIVFRTSRA
jgi:hypothetical protein